MKKTILKTIIYILFTLTIFSCNSDDGSEMLGKWKTEPNEYGTTFTLDISKEGDVYKINKLVLDKNGNEKKDSFSNDKNYAGKYVDGVIEINPFIKLTYSKETDKIFFNEKEYKKSKK